MKDPRVAILTVAVGQAYEDFARGLFASAKNHLDLNWYGFVLPGRPGWPWATLYRDHSVLEWAERTAHRYPYIYLLDADMRFEGTVGREILADLTAVIHPGYVGRRGTYETRPESAACVRDDEGELYYAGGFIGGERDTFLGLCERICESIDQDHKNGITAIWHDESHLNRHLIDTPPTLALSPAYCYPQDATYYLASIWPEPYDRLVVALDKTAEQREGRVA